MDLQKLREKAIRVVRAKLRESVREDTLIVQTVSGIDELEKAANLLSKRLREWYELYNPETSRAISDHEMFAKSISSKSKKELLNELKIKDSMGAELKKEDTDAIMNLAEEVKSIFALKHSQEKYLEVSMKKTCPNVTAITGTQIGAKLISLAGSLERLSSFPASTVQLLGAEKALFRHLRNKRNLPPKYGILHEHTLLSKVSPRNKGKMARTLADKISIAAKVDYFKGKYIGKELSAQVEQKAKELR
ncbi:NOP58 family protein [Candidatus Woesearchaeota archaeon]|nr:NOP58 family protein [Candidatus Woesearchaeota archaeon]